MKEYLNKSLSELLGKWASEIPREGYSSSIQLRTFQLYSRKLSTYKVDDLRFMIGQEYGLAYLIPIAIHYLEDDLLLEAGYYEGDLLSVVLKVPQSFWEEYQEQFSALYELIGENIKSLDRLDPTFEADRGLRKRIEVFIS